MPAKWLINDTIVPNDEQIQAAGSEIMAKLLLQRGIVSPSKMEQFLSPEKFSPVSPDSFVDMEKAVARIKSAIEKGEKILIYGDFDADGVTSTALMFKTLTLLGANVTHYIPDRQMENHGLNKGVLLTKISKEQVKLIITVDCGVSDCAEVSLVKVHGADVIVTDHHEPQAQLPSAYAILDPKVEGALKEDLPFEAIDSLSMMAGVGVAFKLACALLIEYDKSSFAEELVPLVAVGTVADVMPLLNENRLLVAMGLNLIQAGKNKGLDELLKNAGFSKDKTLTAENIAFGIAPRINAVGRLDSADVAFRLLVSDNQYEISICAETMEGFNKMRQELSETTYREAIEYVENNKNENDSVVVAYNKDWHVGIVGIVASKVVEKYNKPVFMFTDGVEKDMLRASIRSTEDINIFDALEANSDMFESFGGHAAAAGVAINKKKFLLEEFKARINQTVFEMTGGKKSEPVQHIDLEVELAEISVAFVDKLKQLEPCGEGNPSPVFALRNLTLETERTIGQENNHLKFICKDKNGKNVDCVYWKHSSLNIPLKSELDIAFSPKINEFNGSRSVQFDIKDYQSENIQISEKQNGLIVLDHRRKTDIFERVVEYVKTSDECIKIFAEDKSVAEKIKKALGTDTNLVTRKNADKAQQLMFFDYPPDKKLLKKILKSSEPRMVHFMNAPQAQYDVDALIATVSGMLKYAQNKYNGNVALSDISVALAINDDLTILLVRLLNRTGVVKVLDFKGGNVHFNFIKPVGIDKIKSHEAYEQCRMELFKIRNFREELMSSSDIKKFVGSL